MQSVWIIFVMLNAALLGWRHCTCLTMDGLLRVYSILFRYLFLCSRYLWFYSVMLDAKIPKKVIVRYCHVFRMENTKYNLLQRRQPWTFYYEFVDIVYMLFNIPEEGDIEKRIILIISLKGAWSHDFGKIQFFYLYYS